MKKSEKPFFSRFLESQDPAKVKSELKAGGGPPIRTEKYPSDDDEYPIPL